MPHTLQVCTLLKDGTIHWIPGITFSFIAWQGADVKRDHFSVRLCFAVTVHVARARRRKGSFFIYAGMFSCTDGSAYPGFGNPPTL